MRQPNPRHFMMTWDVTPKCGRGPHTPTLLVMFRRLPAVTHGKDGGAVCCPVDDWRHVAVLNAVCLVVVDTWLTGYLTFQVASGTQQLRIESPDGPGHRHSSVGLHICTAACIYPVPIGLHVLCQVLGRL